MNTPNSDKPSGGKPGGGKPVIVKKYANRRLYNTATSSYVTLDDLAKLIKEGGDFVAHDAKTGEDITRSVLTQIIVEQAMMAFARNQEQMRKNLQATFGIFPFGQFEEMGKQNMALFERALKMLSPYGREEKPGSAEPEKPETTQKDGEDPRLKRLEAQIET